MEGRKERRSVGLEKLRRVAGVIVVEILRVWGKKGRGKLQVAVAMDLIRVEKKEERKAYPLLKHF